MQVFDWLCRMLHMAAFLYYIEQEVRSGKIKLLHSTFSRMGRSGFAQTTGRILQKFHMKTVKANFLVKAAVWVGALFNKLPLGTMLVLL